MNATIRQSISTITPPPPAPVNVTRKNVKLIERAIGTDMIITMTDGRPSAVKGRVYVWGTNKEVGRYNISLTTCTSVDDAQEEGIRAARMIAHINDPDPLADVMDMLLKMRGDA